MLKKFKTIKTITLIIYFFIISFFIYNSTALANDSNEVYFTPQIAIPNSGITGSTTVSSADKDGYLVSSLIARYITAIYDYGISVAGILAAIMLMAGGVIWLTSGGDSGKVEQAKKIIIGSITGIFILFSAYIILNTINPALVKMQGVPLIIPKNITFFKVTCCDPKKPQTYTVKSFDGKNIIMDGEKKGQEVSCPANAPECKGDNVCTNYSNDDKAKYSCIKNNFCCYCEKPASFNEFGIQRFCKDNIPQQECIDWCRSLRGAFGGRGTPTLNPGNNKCGQDNYCYNEKK